MSVPVNNKVACVHGVCTYSYRGGRGPRGRGGLLPLNLPNFPPRPLDFGRFAGNFFIFSVPRVFLESSRPGLGLAHLLFLLLCRFFPVLVPASSQRRRQLETCSPSSRVQMGLKGMCSFSYCLWRFWAPDLPPSPLPSTSPTPSMADPAAGGPTPPR